MIIQAGGPAFPYVLVNNSSEPMNTFSIELAPGKTADFGGMTLQGLCANPGGPFQANDMSGWAIVNCELDDIAKESYKLADAMLKAREAS